MECIRYVLVGDIDYIEAMANRPINDNNSEAGLPEHYQYTHRSESKKIIITEQVIRSNDQRIKIVLII